MVTYTVHSLCAVGVINSPLTKTHFLTAAVSVLMYCRMTPNLSYYYSDTLTITRNSSYVGIDLKHVHKNMFFSSLILAALTTSHQNGTQLLVRTS